MLTSRKPEKFVIKDAIPDRKTDPLQIFENLAKSHSAFNSVGHIITVKKRPEDTWYQYQYGSGVYMGNQIAITTANVIPSEIKNGEFISKMGMQAYFFVENEKGALQRASIMMAYRHPGYLFDNPTSYKSLKNDIAILLLSCEFKNIAPVTLNYSRENRQHDCTVIGYTDRMTPIPTDDKRTFFFTSNEFKKVGVKTHESYYDTVLKLYVNRIGHSITSGGSCFGCCTLTFSEKNSFDPLEAGTYRGMGGGGYFNKNNTLIGIPCGTRFPDGEASLSHILLDEDYFVPLFNHKVWIETTMNLCKTKLLELMQNNKDDEKYTLPSKMNLDQAREEKRVLNTDESTGDSIKNLQKLSVFKKKTGMEIPSQKPKSLLRSSSSPI